MIERKNVRQSRVSSEIKKILSEFLLRNSVIDFESPCDTSLISITDVELSPCLQHAKIFLVSMSPSFDNSCCIKFLEKHKYKFRNHLGACMRMRYVPDLHFFIDDSFDRVEKIEKLLKSIRK